jgi:hypothetical protein
MTIRPEVDNVKHAIYSFCRSVLEGCCGLWAWRVGAPSRPDTVSWGVGRPPPPPRHCGVLVAIATGGRLQAGCSSKTLPK